MAYSKNKKYDEKINGTIRCNIIEALEELATFNGIDINTIKNTSPYSIELAQFSTQKIAAELKKLIDYGFVVKQLAKGKTVKYMLRKTYEELQENKKEIKEYGYGDYRDSKDDFYNEEEICYRILNTPSPQYKEEW